MSNRSFSTYATCAVLLLALSACGSGADDTTARLPIAEPAPADVATVPTATATDTPATAVTPNDPEPSRSVTVDPPPSSPTPDRSQEPAPITPEPCWLPGGQCPPPSVDRCAALSASVRGWRPDFPPSLPNDSCGAASNYAQPEDQVSAAATEELHVIGIYEGRGAMHGAGSDARVTGVVDVVVAPRPKPIVLALSSYEPVRWRLTLESGAQLARVITQGYYAQEVEGAPDGVEIVHREPGQACSYAYGWEVVHNSGGGNFALMLADIRDVTGLTETSFQGCYGGERFEIPYWTGAPPTDRPTPIPGDEGIPNRAVNFPGCESITTESQYCLTLSGGEVSLLGLDSGQLCHVTDTMAPLSDGYTTSLAWRGEFAYTCSGAGLIRVSLRDGAWEAAQVSCEAVADFNGGLLLMSSLFADPADLGGLSAYSDYQAVLNGDVQRTYNFGWGSTRMTVHGNRWYGAWHSTDSINVGDLDSGELIGVLTLQDYDDWVWGMAATDDGRLVLANGTDIVVVFDTATGERVRELPVEGWTNGLSCTSRAGQSAGTPTPAPMPEHITPSPTPAPRPASLPSCQQLAQSVAGPGQQANYAPSLPIEKNCVGGYGSSNYANADADLVPGATEELHVVGVGGGVGNPGFRDQRQGTVTVNVAARPKPIVLVLGAYESVLWHLDVQPGVQLARVILQGSAPQLVEGAPAATEIVYRGPDDFCAGAYGWEIGKGGNQLMIADVRAYTGLVETSFQGCSTGAEFDVPYWSGEPPTAKPTPLALDESIPREAIAFPGCEAVTQEHQYCLTTTYGGVAILGLDSGAVCPVATAAAVSGTPLLASIAWRGEAMYVCGYAQGLTRLSLVDGSIEQAQVACSAVTDDRGSLLLTSAPFGNGAQAYPSYAAILSGEPSAEYDFGADSRMTAHGGRLYSAWHSTNTVDVFDLTTNESLPPITLDGYDGWVLGMAVTDAGELIISGDTWGDTIYVFDVATGTKLRELRSTTPVFGLSCVGPH